MRSGHSKEKKNKTENHIFEILSTFPGDQNLWNIEVHGTCFNLKTVYELKTKPKIRKQYINWYY